MNQEEEHGFMEKLNCRVKLIYSARVFRLIIAHQRRSSVEKFAVLFALVEYLCETKINEHIVIKRKISDNVSRNGIIENQWSFLR